MTDPDKFFDRNEDEDLMECESCHYPSSDLQEYGKANGTDEKRVLCKICANTFIGNITEYPSHYTTEDTLARIIGYVGNMLLDEIRKGQVKP